MRRTLSPLTTRKPTGCTETPAPLPPPKGWVWLAHGTRKTRRTDPRLFAPVVLTLLTPEELELKRRQLFSAFRPVIKKILDIVCFLF
jgi:hypothetical protein